MATDESLRRGFQLVWQGENGSRRRLVLSDHTGAVPGERVLSFDCQPGVYVLYATDAISAPLTLDAAGCREPRAIALLPAAIMHGTLSLHEGRGVMPGVVPLSVRRCAVSGPDGRIGEYYATVSRNGAFQAALPAGCIDVLAAPAGFAPVPVPSFTAAFREVRDLGRLVLKPGATLLVEARTRNGSPIPNALVSVVSAGAIKAFVGSVLGQGSVRGGYEGRTDSRGGAAFTGISPDTVYVAVRRDTQIGFQGPIELAAGQAVSTGPMLLIGPGAVRILDPGHPEWLPPGAGWAILASPQVCDSWMMAYVPWPDLNMAASGTWPLPFAGRWRLQLHILANGTDSGAVDSQDVDVLEGDEAAVRFSVDRAGFDGRVQIGDRTLPGTLTVASEGRSYQREFSATVDRSGAFRVWLPAPGTYRVRFRDDSGGMVLTSAQAEFTASSPAVIRFRASGPLSGIVVQADGSPAPSALVTAQPTLEAYTSDFARSGVPTLHGDGGGRFTFEALEPGRWELRATWSGRTGKVRAVDVVENQSVGPVRLVLDAKQSLAGRVVDSQGDPVPAATGRFGVEATVSAGPPAGGTFRTDADGYFLLGVGAMDAGALQLAFTAQGRPLTALRVTAPSEPLLLTLPSSGGRFQLVVPSEEQSPGATAPSIIYVLVNDTGAILPLVEAVQVFGAAVVRGPQATTITIPLLACGKWRLAQFTDSKAVHYYLAGVGPLPLVREFVLVPGATVTVDMR
jgi:hypothetical protein